MRLSLRWKILAWFFLNLALIAAGVLWFLRSQFSVGIQSLLAGPTGVRLQAMGETLSHDLGSSPKNEWAKALNVSTGVWRQRGVRAAVFQNSGRLVTGDEMALPPEVTSIIRAYHARMLGPGGPGGPDGPGGPGGPGESRGPGGPPPGRGGPAEGFTRREPPERPPGEGRDGELSFDEGPREVRPNARRSPPPDEPGDFDGRDGLPGARSRSASATPGEFTKFMVVSDHPRLYWAGVHLDSAAGAAGLPYTLVLCSDSIRGGGLYFDYVPWLWLGGAVVLGSVLLWLPLVHGLTRTVRRLTNGAEEIAAGRFEPPPMSERGDELGRLQNAHRHLAQRLDGYVTGQKRFLGDTAHELLSPVARLEVALSIMERRAPEGDRAYAERALEEVHHISALIHELLAFSKTSLAAREVKLEPLLLASLVGEAVEREGGGAPIAQEIRADLRVLAASALVARAVGNVIRNAVRYAGGEEPIEIAAETRGPDVVLTVADHGPGVPEEALPRIFDPFFRPDTSRTASTGGSGLGLAIVKTCVEACRGTVSARNRPGGGFEVVITLPRA